MKVGHERIFLNLHPKDKNADYQALANQVRLEIDLNNQKISSYLSYFIGLLSITISLYLFLLDRGLSQTHSGLYLVFSLCVILFFIYKINRITKKNEREIEGYMGLQAYLSGSKMFVLEGSKKEIKKVLDTMDKIPGLEKQDLMNIAKRGDKA